MHRNDTNSIKAVATVIVPFALVVLGLGVVLPVADTRGMSSLSKVPIPPTNWKDVPLPTAIADLNRKIASTGKTTASVFLDPGVDLSRIAAVTLTLDSLPATEYARYLSELSGLRTYSVPDGIVIDYLHRDHRTWRRQYRDFVRHRILWKLYGRQL